ncbi:MAG: hypothetical protein ACOX3Y_07375 [Clostridia bacterium]|jgi:hypothetical protein
MTDRELLETIAEQVAGLSVKVDGLEKGQKSLVEGQKALANEVKKTNLIIENDIKLKIDALFDGYKQNSEKLDRIEAEVVKHEEFIIKRIK